MRTPNAGSFQPGHARSRGPRKRTPDGVRGAARSYTQQAIETLAEVMRSGSDSARVRAAEALLNRAWGMPESAARCLARDDADLCQMSDAELLAIIDEAGHAIAQACA